MEQIEGLMLGASITFVQLLDACHRASHERLVAGCRLAVCIHKVGQQRKQQRLVAVGQIVTFDASQQSIDFTLRTEQAGDHDHSRVPLGYALFEFKPRQETWR